jgi:hypothetical protein
VKKVPNAEAATILKGYEEFCRNFKEPQYVSCDNGKEFAFIPTKKIDNPSYHPQANGVIERFHRELGKQSSIHKLSPDKVVHLINTNEICATMRQYLQQCGKSLESLLCVMQYATRNFSYNDLVWRRIQRRARAKHEDTYTGPHRILKAAGKLSYFITSHKTQKIKLQVNINDLKEFKIPCTKGWRLLEKYFEQTVTELDAQVKNPKVLINFVGLDSIVQDIIDKRFQGFQFVVVPDWPCMTWYKRLHEEIDAEAIRLPAEEDLFVDEKGKPLGKFAWDNWLFHITPTDVHQT